MPATYTYNITRNELINASLRAIGVLGLNQTAAAEDFSHSSEALNIMVKQWMAKGVVLWKVEELVVTMVAGQRQYTLGPSGTPVFVRPLKILDQGNFIRVIATSEDTSISMLGRSDYEMYGSKFSQSIPNSFFYDPLLTNGILSVYPVPVDATREMHLFAQMPFADFNSASDTADFAQEWLSPLKWGLARELLVEYGCDESTERRIEQRYRETMSEGLNFSQDEASTYFSPDPRGR